MWRIPLSDLNYDQREIGAVLEVLESGWLTMGPRIQEFETWFASHHQSANAVAVANCTCALELAYRYILQESPPDRRCIIVPNITFVATSNAVISAGGTPLLCDIESQNKPYLSLEHTTKLLESRNDIAAVALVHYAGHDAGAEAFSTLCDKHGVALIEDCAHSPGALTPSLRPVGTLGFAGCFSFFSNKNLATGEGGMILTENENFRDWARMARSHGLTSGTWSRHLNEQPSYDVKLPGYNYRCTELTAALGLVQLSKLQVSNTRRRHLTALYRDELSSDDRYHVLMPPPGQEQLAACHILTLLCDSSRTRNRAAELLSREEIQTSHHYAPIHSFSWYGQHLPEVYPSPDASISFAERQLTLPLYPNLSDDQVIEITDLLKSIIP